MDWITKPKPTVNNIFPYMTYTDRHKQIDVSDGVFMVFLFSYQFLVFLVISGKNGNYQLKKQRSSLGGLFKGK